MRADMWADDHVRFLIDERKNRNDEFHINSGKSKVDFWNEVAAKINYRFKTLYTSKQCSEKFQNLVRDYRVSFLLKCF